MSKKKEINNNAYAAGAAAAGFGACGAACGAAGAAAGFGADAAGAAPVTFNLNNCCADFTVSPSATKISSMIP